MTASAAKTLLDDIDKKVADKTTHWRTDALRQIIDLFVVGAAAYDTEQTSLFDAVISRLMPKNTDRKIMAGVSSRMAATANAPRGVIAVLAQHPDSAVCGPILMHSNDVSDQTLIAVADREPVDQKKLHHVAGRAQLSEAVTDTLIKRGDKAVRRKIVDNLNASITETGYAMLVASMAGDKDMAVAIAARGDVPQELRPWLDEAIQKK